MRDETSSRTLTCLQDGLDVSDPVTLNQGRRAGALKRLCPPGLSDQRKTPSVGLSAVAPKVQKRNGTQNPLMCISGIIPKLLLELAELRGAF